jgi:PKD repeat protein
MTAKGWKATADALINSLKAGVGTAKMAYSAAPISASLGFTKKLSAAQAANLEKKLEAVELAAAAFGCAEFGTALLSTDTPEQLTNIVMKGASCVSSLTEKDRFRKFFDGASVVDNVQNGKHAIAIIDGINLLVSFAPETPPWVALSGLLDVTSAVINSQIIAAEYNAESTKDMLVLQSAVEAEIKRVLDGQFAWYTKRLINARLDSYFVVNYVVADFVMTPDAPTVGVEVALEARVSSSKEQINSYAWDFGDGTTEVSTGFTMKPTTKHIYMQAGSYTVKLTVTSGFLDFKTVVTKTITVGAAIDENPKDGIPDWWETNYGVTDANGDDDGDGLSNIDEYKAGTKPSGEGAKDSDDDGFTDKEEVDAGTSPTDSKTWPLVLNVLPLDGAVRLNWNHAPNSTPEVDHYNVCYATAVIDPKKVVDYETCRQVQEGSWLLGAANPRKIDYLDPTKTYYFLVLGMAFDDKQVVRVSNVKTAKPVDVTVPKNLTANAVLQKTVELTWDAVEGATSYAYCVSTTPNSPDCSSYSASNPLWKGVTETTAVVDGLTNGTAYYFRVVAKNDSGESPVSAEATATPNVISLSSGVKAIAAGSFHSLALKQDGTLITWGHVSDGLAEPLTIPAGLNGVVAIAAGASHSLALKQDGTVVAWGWQGNAPATVPAGLNGVTAIAASCGSSMALKQDGTVVAWEWSGSGQPSVPAGLNNVKAIAAGCHHYLAVKQDGTVVAWGYAWDGQRAEDAVPVGLTNVVAVAAGSSGHSLALKQDGTVVAWGGDPSVQGTVPAGLMGVKAIAAGGDSTSLAVKQDGTVVTWGYDIHIDPSPVAASLSGVVAVAADGGDPFTQAHFLALKQDGTVVAWGGNGNGQATVPDELTKPSDTSGWTLNPTTGHYYKALDNCGNWEQCETAAQAVGAHLVVLDDQAENDWVANTFVPPINTWGYWIGYTDKEQEGVWKTVTGITVTGDVYTHWYPGNPDNYGGNQNYAVMHAGNQWNDTVLDHTDNPTVAVIERTNPSGNANPFTVQAADETGTAFTVPAGKTQCTFTATGTWGECCGSSFRDANGGSPMYISNSALPSAPIGSLIMRRSSGTYEFVGGNATKSFVVGESANFLFNDMAAYGDNSGTLSVSWSCQ